MSIPDAMLRAVEDEVREVRHRLGDLARLRVTLTKGRLQESTPGAYLYAFDCEPFEDGGRPDEGATSDGFQLPEDTSGMAKSAGRYVPAVVITHDPAMRRMVVELQLHAPLPDADRVELSFSTLFILTSLHARLEECRTAPLPLLEAALAGGGEALPSAIPIPPASSPQGTDQAEAIRFAVERSVSFLWGPPGTGKTRTLAHLTRRLVDAGESVLLTASTNVAVDRLVESTLDVLGSPARPPVVRIGRAGRNLRGRGVSPEELISGDDALARQVSEFAHAARGLSLRAPEPWALDTVLRIAGWVLMAEEVLSGLVPADTLRSILDLARALLAAVDERLASIPVMATTLCGAFMRPEPLARRFDTVIVDEASMASVAHFAAAASLAARRIVIAGDFQQLPPIVLADTPDARRFLGQHPFSFAGCDDVSADHPSRRMLGEQWRMHPAISRVVSRVFYGDRLRDAPGVTSRPAPPDATGALLVDTHGLRPRTQRTRSRSIRNALHARLVADLVATSGRPSIGVIAPYRAQARAIRQALRGRCRSRLEDGSIQVSTVHRFQGEERDLIVFDTTDAPDASGHFLDDARNPTAANLVNVAISRAKHALIVIGDVPHVRGRLGPGSAIHRVMLELIRRDGGEVDASDADDLLRARRFLLDPTCT